MTDVFISYSTKDQEIADVVKQRLESRDLDVFLASESIRPGEKWTEQIHQALEEARWVFVLVTKNSNKSPVVQQEVGGALYGKKKLVPIIAGVSSEKVPRWLADYQGIVIPDESPEHVADEIDKLAKHVSADVTKRLLLLLGAIALIFYILSRS